MQGKFWFSVNPAMGNMPESTIDPNGEKVFAALSSSSPSNVVQLYTNMNLMFGADNWELGKDNEIIIAESYAGIENIFSLPDHSIS